MRVLGIDTSTWRAAVGICEDGKPTIDRHLVVRSSHAAAILPLIDDALVAAELSISDIDAIAAANGPGSFTGLRVAVSIATGLSVATGARLTGVSTLAALALAAKQDGPVCAMLDARRGEVYWGLYDCRDGIVTAIHADGLSTFENAVGHLPRGVTLIGDAITAYGARAREVLGEGVCWLPFPEYGPSGSAVAMLGYRRLAENPEGDAALEPAYLRPSEAEIKVGR